MLLFYFLPADFHLLKINYTTYLSKIKKEQITSQHWNNTFNEEGYKTEKRHIQGPE